MTIIVDGTNGLSDVDGTAATPAIRGTDTNTGIFFPAADTIAFSEGGVEAMRIDSLGNVGIGTTTPNATAKLHVNGISQIGTTLITDGGSIELGAQGTGDRNSFIDFHSSGLPSTIDYSSRIIRGLGVNGDMALINAGGGGILWLTSDLERMRIAANGDVGIAGAIGLSGARFSVSGSIAASTGYATKAGNPGAFSGNTFHINWTGTPQLWIDATNIGTIAFTSDYRIKRNIQTQTAPALERVMQLRPVTYQMADYGTLFKQSEEIKEGFIAHEVQAIIPSGVDGAKDDKTQIQSLRLDAMLAVAIKAIQELKTEFDAYKASHP